MSDVANIADSQGTTFTFGGVTFIAKNVKVKKSRTAVDVTPLSAASGSQRTYQGGPLLDDSITLEYYGNTAPTVGTRAAITCTVGSISGFAVCEDFELTAAVGELIMGNATFKMSH